MDGFIQIIEENDLRPEDIEKIKPQPHPIVQFRLWRENTLRTSEDYCFNGRYLIACAAHRINPARWHDPDIKKDVKIRQFMERVEFDVIVDENDFGQARLKDPRAYQMRIEIVAKGKAYKKVITYPKGAWDPIEVRNTDEELVRKFTDNASKVLSLVKAKKAAENILELEKLKDVSELMRIVSS